MHNQGPKITAAEMANIIVSGYQSALRSVGLNEDFCARKARELINAKRVEHIKAQGLLPEDGAIPEGYEVVAETTMGVVLRVEHEDYAVQQRQLAGVEKMLQFAPAERLQVEDGGLGSIMGDVIREIQAEAEGLPPLPSQLPDTEDE